MRMRCPPPTIESYILSVNDLTGFDYLKIEYKEREYLTREARITANIQYDYSPFNYFRSILKITCEKRCKT